MNLDTVAVILTLNALASAGCIVIIAAIKLIDRM